MIGRKLPARKTEPEKKGRMIDDEISRIKMEISSIRNKKDTDDLDEAIVDELSTRLDHESARKEMMLNRSEKLKYLK